MKAAATWRFLISLAIACILLAVCTDVSTKGQLLDLFTHSQKQCIYRASNNSNQNYDSDRQTQRSWPILRFYHVACFVYLLFIFSFALLDLIYINVCFVYLNFSYCLLSLIFPSLLYSSFLLFVSFRLFCFFKFLVFFSLLLSI
jgi:hypothetical protein